MTTGSVPLQARTRRLDADIDLVAVAGGHGVLWESPDTSLAGRGETLRLNVDRSDPARCASTVSDALAAVEIHDEVRLPGTGLAALGAWPFAPTLHGELMVPEVLVGRSPDGTRWITTVVAADGTDLATAHDELVDALLADLAGNHSHTLAGFSTSEPLTPAGFDLASFPDPAIWCASVQAACDELRAGVADKVVLAREVRVTATAPLPVEAIIGRLRRTFPDALRFSIDGFVGASPELLVGRSGDIVRCHPMAGTAPRSGDPAADGRLGAALLASDKNRLEHQHTIDLVHDTLIGYCSYLDAEAEPSIVAMANVQHLGTRVEGRLSSPPASVIELMTVLHPTPAVCGRTRAQAMDLIARHEAIDRGRYAGPVGWVDVEGNGAWAVGIRSAEIDGPVARVMAGVGVVADSDPLAELAETRAKLQAMLGAIVRP
jgi:isochorismate synthase